MVRKAHTAEEIEAFVFANIAAHPGDIAVLVGEHFGISRQAVSRHLRRLVVEKKITATGSTRSRRYVPAPLVEETLTLPIVPGLEEHRVWLERVEPLLRGLPKNIADICFYGFTEMLNNAIEHSAGTTVAIKVKRTLVGVTLIVVDDGVGIFQKIATELHLEDERHAVLELSKGKLTTAREGHSGEGIFFTSRMFDEFTLASGTISLVCFGDGRSVLFDRRDTPDTPDFGTGTSVFMSIGIQSPRTTKEVFDRFSAPLDEDYGFVRTSVPVTLARRGEENLISRSQAKRLLARFDRFKEVILDFAGIETIGQAFADEVFRVFADRHPGINLIPIHTVPDVEKMIRRALSARSAGPAGGPAPGEHS